MDFHAYKEGNLVQISGTNLNPGLHKVRFSCVARILTAEDERAARSRRAIGGWRYLNSERQILIDETGSAPLVVIDSRDMYYIVCLYDESLLLIPRAILVPYELLASL